MPRMAMDSDTVLKALAATYSVNNNERTEAEKFFDTAKNQQGFLTFMLQLVVKREAEQQTIQAAAIQIKNKIRGSWDEDMLDENAIKEKGIAPEEKAFIRAHIFEACVLCPQLAVRRQLEECIRLIVSADFPERWPDLLDLVLLNLQTRGEPMRTYTALMVLRKIAAKYELRGQDKREALDQVVERTFPVLIPLAAEVMKHGLGSEDAAGMLKLILKTYWSTTQLSLTKALMAKESFDVWMELIVAATQAPVPPEALSADETTRDGQQQMKLKKWALQIAHRFYSRYGSPNLAREKDGEKAFAKHFLSTWAPRLQALYVQQLKDAKEGKLYLTRRVTNIMLQFLSQSLAHASAYNLLKPSLDLILFDVCFPLVCVSQKDVEQWEEDPAEFVKLQSNMDASFNDPKESALEFFKEVCKLRGKENVNKILHFCHQILQTYAQTKDTVHKSGALYVVGSIVSYMAKKNIPLEGVLAEHVLPEFCSPDKFLRHRACWTYERFLPELRKAKGVSEATVRAYHAMLNAMKDPELPVRVQAGIGLRQFIRLSQEPIRAAVLSTITDVMKSLLSVMAEIDHEELVATLETLVQKYEDDILPFAAELIKYLVQAFDKMISRADEDADSEMAAMSTIKTITSILEACTEETPQRPQVFAVLEPLLYPLLDKLFDPDQQEFLEEASEVLSYLSLYCPVISPKLWSYFGKIHQAVCGGSTPSLQLPEVLEGGWAPDYMDHFIIPLDNMMTRDSQGFLTGVNENGIPLRHLIPLMVKKVMTCGTGTADIVLALKLLIVYLEVAAQPGVQGCVDDMVPGIVGLIWEYLNSTAYKGAREVKATVSQTLAILVYYSPAMFLRASEQLGVTGALFSKWFEFIASTKKAEGRKALVLALSRLLRHTTEARGQVPQVVIDGLSHVVTQMAVQTEQFTVSRSEEEKAQEEGEFEDEDGDDDEDEDDDMDSDDEHQELDDHQDASTEKDRAYLDRLEQEAKKIAEGQEDDDDDDDDDSDYAPGDDDGFRTSPLDVVNPVMFAAETLQTLPPDAQAQVAQWLGPQAQSKLAELVEMEKKRIAEEQAKAAAGQK